MCLRHYKAERRRAGGVQPRRAAGGPCEVRGCSAQSSALGLCDQHYATQHRYKVPAAQLAAIREAQSGLCAICGRVPGGRGLHVDHNHSTGAVRALLCGNCNLLIGHAGECPDILRRAAAYLKEHE
jgi:hypothetical protein